MTQRAKEKSGAGDPVEPVSSKKIDLPSPKETPFQLSRGSGWKKEWSTNCGEFSIGLGPNNPPPNLF